MTAHECEKVDQRIDDASIDVIICLVEWNRMKLV